jgi:chromosome segregation ATPase
MKTNILLSAFLLNSLITIPAFSQSMQEQLKALESVESEIKTKQEFRRQEYIRQQEAQATAERTQREAEDKKRRIAADKADAAAKEQRAILAKKQQKNESYDDELKKISLEEKQLELQVKKAKVKRADDYIDQELNREKAKTDVIQSDADTSRNISTGAKNMMTGIGKGEENKSKGWSLFKKKD